MNEQDLRGLIEGVRRGRLSRRAFTRTMVALGLTAPMATQMLAFSGVAVAAEKPVYKPTKRGGGGALKVLWWQGPTLLNPHFAVGTKDQDGSRMFYEPLAGWDADGNLVPVLAAEIPTVENGGLAEDGKSVTWKLKQGVKWHDGHPFTADDCVFNWEYAADPATAAVTIGSYKDVKVVKIDDHTIRVEFAKPTPFWADAFVGTFGMIIPKHLFEPYKGAKSREAPANLAPVGTGAYLFVDFKPGDLVQGKINPNYHMDNRPYFDTIEMKGGGDAVSAARAVLQTGEYDFAWNMQVEDEILKRLEASRQGPRRDLAWRQHRAYSAQPHRSLEGSGRRAVEPQDEASVSDRPGGARCVQPAGGSRLGAQVHLWPHRRSPRANFVNAPEKFVSTNASYDFNVDKAIKLLDDAGWKPGADGVREKNGVKLKVVYQSSINAPRQKTQAIVKQACQKAGIEVEIKSVTASVFFSSDVANPDTYPHFYCDLQMYTTTMSSRTRGCSCGSSCQSRSRARQTSAKAATSPAGRMRSTTSCTEQSDKELDPVKRAAMFIAMNDLVIKNVVVIPVVTRPAWPRGQRTCTPR